MVKFETFVFSLCVASLFLKFIGFKEDSNAQEKTKNQKKNNK